MKDELKIYVDAVSVENGFYKLRIILLDPQDAYRKAELFREISKMERSFDYCFCEIRDRQLSENESNSIDRRYENLLKKFDQIRGFVEVAELQIADSSIIFEPGKILDYLPLKAEKENVPALV